MNFRSILAILGVLVFGVGVVTAMSGADVILGTELRWAGNSTAGSDVTEGGNITNVDVNETLLTDQWAEYWGLLYGAIVLDDDGAGDAVYIWAWNDTVPGDVCVSTDSTFAWASAVAATAANIDTDFTLSGTSIDSAANTFTGPSCALDFIEADVPATISANLTAYGSSSFQPCAISDGGTGSKDNYAFCVPTQDDSTGLNYAGTAANYELIVPTTPGSGTETYYFYAELE